MSNLSVRPSQALSPSVTAPQTTAPKTAAKPVETPQVVAEADEVKIKTQTAREVSPIITLSGGAFAGSLVGGVTGAVLTGGADIIWGKAQSLAEASSFGGGVGAAAGFISGGVVAHLTDSKLKATLYGAASGAVIGAVAGARMAKNVPAALVGGGLGAITGATSAFTTSHWLGH